MQRDSILSILPNIPLYVRAGKLLTWFCALAAFQLAALQGAGAHAGKFKVLHSFCEGSCADGAGPNPLIEDKAGNWYGTTVGGQNFDGVVFELKRRPGGGYLFETLYQFNSVADPYGPLIIDTSGNLYGVAQGNSIFNVPGEVFELVHSGKGNSWTFQHLHTFCVPTNCQYGNVPLAGLTYAGQQSGAPYDGKGPLYGTASQGAKYAGGAVFELKQARGVFQYHIIYSFGALPSCSDGCYPAAPMIMDSAGNLYGTTEYGGLGGIGTESGTVFELSPAGKGWKEKVLHAFCSERHGCADGVTPANDGLAMDQSGNLYGFTAFGGGKCVIQGEWQGCGVAFKLVFDGTKWKEKVLHEFCTKPGCRDGGVPATTPVLEPDGRILGTAGFGGDFTYAPNTGGGILFELNGSAVRTLHSFCHRPACTDGLGPVGLARDSQGDVFGNTIEGGDVGEGIIYQVMDAAP